MRLLFPLLAVAAGLSGCAGRWTRSYHRWEAMQSSGPHAAWARCIDERANAYLTNEPAPAWYKGRADAPDQAIFTWVLADCAGLMRGAGWDHLPAARYERLIADAYEHFFGVAARIRGEEMEGIV